MNTYFRCRILVALTASLFVWGLAGAASAGAGQEEPKLWRDEEGFRAASFLQRGINLSNAWEAPPGTWGDRTYGKADFRAIRRAGFDHVRIPVAWHHYMGPAPEHALNGEIFEEIDRLVDMARRERLAVVLTWHHFDRFTDSPDDAAVNQWHAGWRQIAMHYRTVSRRGLMFELLNEPRDAATTARMNVLYPAVIAAVREVDPMRTLIVSPGDWGSMKAVPELCLPRELRNLVATGHSYEPFLFTHQGASWTGNLNGTRGIVFPGPPPSPIQPAADAPEWVTRWVADHNQKPETENPSGPVAFVALAEAAAEWSRREGRAVYIGEFGAAVWADAASRVRYGRAMREELERHGLGWAWWDWKSNFAVAAEGPAGTLRIDAALRDALIEERRAAGKVHAARGPRK
jgi:endoglucanase